MSKKHFFLFSFYLISLLPSISFARSRTNVSWEQTKKEITQEQCYLKVEGNFNSKHWTDLIKYCDLYQRKFKNSLQLSDVYYYKALGYFHKRDFDLSSRAFSSYLSMSCAPKHFEEVFYYKFAIAEQFRKGAKKRMFKGEKSLKIASAKEEAVSIYEEVVHSLPHHELAPHAYFGKALVLSELEDYREAIETLQQLIQKHPKHDLAIESFLQIAKIYMLEANPKRQDPDLLDLAQLNLVRFGEAFPREERLKTAKQHYLEMENIFASGLYEIGRFYERTHKIAASEIYYKKILSSFPQTKSANLSLERMNLLNRKKSVAK